MSRFCHCKSSVARGRKSAKLSIASIANNVTKIMLAKVLVLLMFRWSVEKYITLGARGVFFFRSEAGIVSGEAADPTKREKNPSGRGSYKPHFHANLSQSRSLIGLCTQCQVFPRDDDLTVDFIG